jgi:hypothetical protein
MSNTLSFYDPADPDTGYLSNFYRAPFELDGRSWPTVEHYYQAQKFTDEAYAERIRLAASPREAKTLGQTQDLPLREDWATHRMTAMLSALAAKFTQNEELRTRLLATGDAIFAEASPTDAFWGDGADGQGENRLGYLMTTLRNHLRLFLANEGTASMSSDELAQKCFASVRQLHVTWFLPDALRMEAQVGVMPESINAYCRDANLPEHVLAQYRPGLIFREPTLCDASQHFGGFAARHRYLLLSGTARHLDALFGGLSGSPGTGLSVWQPDTLWKVLSVHQQDDHTQITLLEVPPVAIYAFIAQALTTLEQGLAEKADEYFKRALAQERVLACATPEWLERLEHPLGINDDGEFLECWFNGVHRESSTADPAPMTQTAEISAPDAKSSQPKTDSRWRLVARVLGVVIMLVGCAMGFELITMTPRPPQMIVLAIVMIGLGGMTAWKPDLVE